MVSWCGLVSRAHDLEASCFETAAFFCFWFFAHTCQGLPLCVCVCYLCLPVRHSRPRSLSTCSFRAMLARLDDVESRFLKTLDVLTSRAPLPEHKKTFNVMLHRGLRYADARCAVKYLEPKGHPGPPAQEAAGDADPLPRPPPTTQQPKHFLSRWLHARLACRRGVDCLVHVH